jgi:hypothetical protein
MVNTRGLERGEEVVEEDVFEGGAAEEEGVLKDNDKSVSGELKFSEGDDESRLGNGIQTLFGQFLQQVEEY